LFDLYKIILMNILSLILHFKKNAENLLKFLLLLIIGKTNNLKKNKKNKIKIFKDYELDLKI